MTSEPARTGEPVPQPPILPIDAPAAVAAAVEALQHGRVIAYPTDTLYGVGGDALSEQAARATHEAKGRDPSKGFPVLLADAAAARRLVRDWPAAAARLAARCWPGALTLVLPAQDAVPDLVRTGDTVAVRVPGHASLRAVIAAAGVPLIGTSANRSGQPAALTAQAAAAALGQGVALVLDGGAVGGRPSTVVGVDVDGAGGAGGAGIIVLREGAISREAIAEALGVPVALVASAAPAAPAARSATG